MNLLCWIFGHKPFELDILKGFNQMMFRDAVDGTPVIKLCMCRRCRTAFFE